MTFLLFLPSFWKVLAVRGRKFSDCQRNPTIAVKVSLNLHLRLDISDFFTKILKSLGSSWQNYWRFSMESNHSSKCKFESLFVPWNFCVFLPRFWKNLAVRGRNIKDCRKNPTTAMNVSLNLYLRLDFSFFLPNFLKRLGSAWQIY